MSKETNNHRYSSGGGGGGAPYRKPDRSTFAGSSGSGGGGSGSALVSMPQSSSPSPTLRQAPARLTINNYTTFNARAKRLPPDANTAAAVNTKLWQFPEPVLFACAKCRRDNVQSDGIAIDPRNKIVLCAPCFTRIIRPRTYKPGRAVPFPSLLSWLNYKPSTVMEVSEDVIARPAEAVAPSGNRMALPTLANGDRPMGLDKLPAIAMNVVPTRNNSNHHGAGVGAKHPCLRVWGSCQHGETCLFRNAPTDLCLAFLMGLCRGDHRGKTSSNNINVDTKQQQQRVAAPVCNRRPVCNLLHQHIYDLPSEAEPAPELRYVGDLGEEDGPDDNEEEEERKEDGSGGGGAVMSNKRLWMRWVDRRRKSPNSAEWQLWNNGALQLVFDVYVPAMARPVVVPVVVAASEGNSGGHGDASAEEATPALPAPSTTDSNVRLNLSDIMSALKGIKK